MSSAPYWNNSEFIDLGRVRGQLHSSPLASPALNLVHTYSVASLVLCILVSSWDPGTPAPLRGRGDLRTLESWRRASALSSSPPRARTLVPVQEALGWES